MANILILIDLVGPSGELGLGQLRAISAIEMCRTAELGGHDEACVECGVVRYAFNSCLMGKFRNGELASRSAVANMCFRHSRSPLPRPP
jgi:hypothetical protein